MASHRKNKNTEHTLDYFLEGLTGENEIVKKRLLDLHINVCTACEYCSKHRGKCVFKDDMEELILDMLYSDLIVIATPLYFNSVTSLLKIMIDRTQTLYNAWYTIKDPIFKEKKAVVIISDGGSRTYKDQFLGITVETQHFLTNINGKLIDFIKYNNTDRQTLIGNQKVALEVGEAAKEIEQMIIDGSWQRE